MGVDDGTAVVAVGTGVVPFGGADVQPAPSRAATRRRLHTQRMRGELFMADHISNKGIILPVRIYGFI
jgi:hypothetical protein